MHKRRDDSTKEVAVLIVKQLKHFIKESCSEMLEESAHLSETGTTRNPRSRKKPKKSTSKTVSAADSDSDFERVQKKILLFFGSLDSSVYEYLLPDADELGQLATALDSERHLKFSVPFPDSRPLIYLVILLLILPLFILNKLK